MHSLPMYVNVCITKLWLYIYAVVSSSSDTSDNEFDYTSSEKEDTITKPRYMKKMKGGKNNNPALGKPSAFGGFMKDMEGAPHKSPTKRFSDIFGYLQPLMHVFLNAKTCFDALHAL